MDPEELELVKTEYEDLRIRYHKQTRSLKVSLRVVFTSMIGQTIKQQFIAQMHLLFCLMF